MKMSNCSAKVIFLVSIMVMTACGDRVPTPGELGPNTPPSITSSVNQSILEGRTIVTTLAAEDAESNPVNFEITGGDDQAFFTISSAQLQFVQAPDYEDAQDLNTDNVYEVSITANDGQAFSDAVTLLVTVDNTNEPVVQVNSPENYQTFVVNEAVSFTASATDIEDDASNTPLQYLWNFGQNSDVQNNTALNPTVNFPNVGSFSINFSATDSDGNTGSITHNVQIDYPPIPDISFDANGLNPGSNGEGSAFSTYRIAGLAIDNNNRVIMASSRICDNTCFTSYLLLRRYIDGVRDNNYGPSTGHVLSTETLSASANAIATDNNNRLLVVGNRGGNMVIWRYDTTGQEDNSMNSTAGTHFRVHNGRSTAYFVMLDSQNRYVVTGYIGAQNQEKMAVWRFLNSGAPDTNFANNGVFIDDSPASVSVGMALSENSNGDILVAGYGDFDSRDLLTWKLSSTGVADSNFGNSSQFNNQTLTGLYRFDDGSTEQARSISTDSNDNIYVVGIGSASGNDGLLVKMTSQGRALNFGANPAYVYSETDVSNELFNTVKIVNDKIRILGMRQWGTFSDALLIQLNLDATPDTGFKNGTIIRSRNAYYFSSISYLSMDLMQMDSLGRIYFQTGFDRGFRVHRYRF